MSHRNLNIRFFKRPWVVVKGDFLIYQDLRSFAARSRHLTKISYSKAKKIGLFGQRRATDITQ